MKRRENEITVTGLGCCCAAGLDVPSVQQSIDKTIIRYHTDATELFSPFPVAPVFSVEISDIFSLISRSVGQQEHHHNLQMLNRTTSLALVAICEALLQSHLGFADLKKIRVGIALGTTVGCTFLSEDYYTNWKENKTQHDNPIFSYLSANLAEQIQRILQVKGPRAVITNACASGTDAIGMAHGWLCQDHCDIAIAGGADGLSRIACHGFSSLMLVSKKQGRPFDADRDGLNLGEGAGILIMEQNGSARARQAPVLGWVRGYGAACDAYHPTTPHPEGRGLQQAIHRAVHQAGIALNEISYINAHGTGTPANDAAELNALAHIGFADRPECPVLSTKGATGHTLGAAGGIEAVLTLCTLNAGVTSGNIGCINQDGRLPLTIPTEKDRWSFVGKIGMSESLAFGGSNAAVILEGAL